MKAHHLLHCKISKKVFLIFTCFILLIIQTKLVYANDPPTAEAGPDQTVEDADSNGMEVLTLDGSGSSDSDGTIERYIWEYHNDTGSTGDEEYWGITLNTDRPVTNLLNTSMTGSGEESAALKSDIKEAMASGKTLYIPAGNYDLSGWGHSWDTETSGALKILGDSVGQTILDFGAPNGSNTGGRIDFRSTAIYVWDIEFRNTWGVFKPPYLSDWEDAGQDITNAEFYNVKTENVTRFFSASASLKEMKVKFDGKYRGPNPNWPEIAILIAKNCTFNGNAGTVGTSDGSFHVNYNWGKALFEDCSWDNRSVTSMYMGTEWDPNKNGWHYLDWPGPGSPVDDRRGFGNVYIRRCTMQNFYNASGAMNGFDTRYINRLYVLDSDFNNIKNGDGGDCEAIYAKCRRGFIERNTVVDGTTPDGDGAISLKLGHFDCRFNNVNNSSSGDRLGYGIYFQSALGVLEGNITKNAETDVVTTSGGSLGLGNDDDISTIREWIADNIDHKGALRIYDHTGDGQEFLRANNPEVIYYIKGGSWTPTGDNVCINRYDSYAPQQLIKFEDFTFNLQGGNCHIISRFEDKNEANPEGFEIVNCTINGEDNNDYLAQGLLSGEEVRVTSTGISDISDVTGNGTLITSDWTPTDLSQTIATGVNPTVDLSLGTHEITLTVMDDDSATDTDVLTVTVTEVGGGSDTNPPAAPYGLSAKASDSSVSLNWDDNSESDLAGYHIFRSETAGSGYSKMNDSLVSISDYTDSSVTNGNIYYYVVTAEDTSGNESEYSGEVSAAPSGGGGDDGIVIDNTDSGYSNSGIDSPSGAPGYYGSNYYHDGSPEASPGDWGKWTPSITTAGEYNIYMQWSAYDNRPDAAPLEIKYNGGTDDSKTVNQQTNGGQFNFIGTYYLSTGTDNYVMIKGDDAGWTVADAVKFEYIGAGDTIPPAAPANLSATGNEGSVSLNWDDNSESDLAGYHVFRSTTSNNGYSQISSSRVSTSEYTDNNVTNDTTYYYVVTAEDENGNQSDYSGETSATPSSDDSGTFISPFKNQELGLNVYPNPASDLLNIKFPTSKLHHIQLIAMDGRLVQQEQSTGKTLRLNVEGLRQGLYIIKVKTGDNVNINRVMIVR